MDFDKHDQGIETSHELLSTPISRRRMLELAALASGSLSLGQFLLGSDPAYGAETAEPAQSHPSVNKNMIVIGAPVDVVTMDPYNYADELTGGSLDKLVFENLVWATVNAHGHLGYKPLLATSWKQTGPKVWQIKLRRGVKFQDGSPFSAADVKFTFDRYSNSKALVGNSWAVSDEWYAGIDVVDKYTVNIHTKYATATLYEWLAYAPKIISKTAVEKAGQTNASELSGAALVGTGAFKLGQRVKGEFTDLHRFAGYWGVKPRVATIQWKPVTDDATRVAALESGQIDLCLNVPVPLVAGLKGRKGIQVFVKPSSRYDYIWLDMAKPPFNDRRVRQAANYAVDVQAISKKLFNGYATPANSPLTPNNFGYAKQTAYHYNPAKAAQLLKEAGVKTPVDVTFWAPQGRYLEDSSTAAAVQGYLNNVGFNVNLQIMEWGTLSQKMFAEKQNYEQKKSQYPAFDMLFLSWGSTTLDADYALYEVFHSGEAYNFAFYDSKAVDSDLVKARVSHNQKQRKQLYADAERRIMVDAPQLFLYYEPQTWAIRSGLENLLVLPFGHYILRNAYWK